MILETTLIGTISYSIGAGAFLLLTLLLAINFERRLQGSLLFLACFVTFIWLSLAAYQNWSGLRLTSLIEAMENLRSVCWIAFLWSVLQGGSSDTNKGLGRYIVSIFIAFSVLLLGYELYQPLSGESSFTVRCLLRLMLVIAGLMLIETLFRNTSEDERWKIKFLCIGIGGLFAYDLFFYADALLFGEVNPGFQEARGGVQAMVVPLLAISSRRNQMWRTNITVSRKIAFYSTTLTTSGLYIIGMAGVGFFLQQFDGAWGTIIQATFFFGAVIVLAVLLISGTVRAHIKVLIGKHFYAYRYDYREEWLRFTRTVSESQETEELGVRVIQAIADIVESPGGALWLQQDDRYVVYAAWNMAVSSLRADEATPMARFLEERQWLIDVAEVQENPAKYGDLALPESLSQMKNAWIIIPLTHHATFIGFLLLARPRAVRALGWEDYDLLKTTGRQAASYLAEQKNAVALAEAREFAKFNRRFAFVIHDIKNLVSQLELLSKNMERHGHNEQFREDMTDTLNDAVSKMRRLMDRLGNDQPSVESSNIVQIGPLLEKLTRIKQSDSIDLSIDWNGIDVTVAADQERLSAIINHLLQNAIDAVGSDGWVKISLNRKGDTALIEVADNGPGMDRNFVMNELFTPFRSTKSRGMGIGAYQCREYARELGGDLEVISNPGAGTTMRIFLPIVDGTDAKELAPEPSAADITAMPAN
ncbi:XrtA/PEP-CTERM system histidine kinase PrsK [Denitrobaculum tricleocarpae]|uniref:histidine kinase n=1 Tax=Denitrobaculum tricleocarpae TaxID=2591009 RepID=A0A545TG69_9PROT|nr:XrtA/PEP-CTERM system histidine kinase PrsK [Denitrobaculum tricleocarpae]TQV76234.1 PEP-CTERM system histidine kinase PrsK [Denitrobaculum tricleocarpae]